MSVYFLDSSAIVKRYVAEQGSKWIATLCNPTQNHDLYIAQAALVEVVATFCRKAREQKLTFVERNTIIATFRQDCQDAYAIRIVNEAIYVAAGDLCLQHKLRAYDAIQLACALAVQTDALANNSPTPIFVCADNDLLTFAAATGLNTENPNTHL